MKRRRFHVSATVVVGGVGTVRAPSNVEVPPYRFLSDRQIEIGVDPNQRHPDHNKR